MLSKIFNSARSIFNSKSQTVTTEEASTEKTTTEMVTTRGQEGKLASDEGQEGEGTIVVDSPSSLRKRQRDTQIEEGRAAAEEEIDSTPTKKQKILPLREKDIGPDKNTRVVVEIPVSKQRIELQDTDSSATVPKGNSDRESVTNDDGEASDAVQDVLEISNSESEGGSEASKTPAKLAPAKFQSKMQKDSSEHRERNKQNTLTASPKASEGAPILVQPKHKRFGSEEPEVEILSTAVERLESSEDDNSDDDAPEIVGTMDALKSAMSKALDAARVVEEKETAIRKKRQERDVILKKQAAIKKRKRAAKSEDRAQISVVAIGSKPSEGTGVGGDGDIDNDVDAQQNGDTAASLVRDTESSMPAISTANLPDLLPDEYLQDEEPESLIRPESESERPWKKSKRTKFADLVEKKPKDRRVGSTTYRVSGVSSKNLAPKSSFHARSAKELWLKGRPGNSAGGSRKPFNSGFFKPKK